MFTETERKQKITERMTQIPQTYRRNYAKAVQGRSMKAGIKSFCLECMHWQKVEVRNCTALACSLYPYRPYQEPRRRKRKGGDDKPEQNQCVSDDESDSLALMCPDSVNQ